MANKKATTTTQQLSEQDEQWQVDRRARIALLIARGARRDLDPTAVLPGEDAELRAAIAVCTQAARRVYREQYPDDLDFQLIGDGQHRSESMNWEEFLVRGSVLDLIEEGTGASRQEILQFARDTCAPTNKALIDLEIEKTVNRAGQIKTLAVIGEILPLAKAGAKASRNQAARAKVSRNKNIILPNGRRYESIISALAKLDKDSHTEIDLWDAFKAHLARASADPCEVSDESGKRDKLRMEFYLSNNKKLESRTFRGLMNTIAKKRKTS